MDFTNVTKALTARGFKVSSFETAKEAAEYLNTQIDGATVGFGGSITLEELGLYALLSGHNTVFSHWHLPEGGDAASLRAQAAGSEQLLLHIREAGSMEGLDFVLRRGYHLALLRYAEEDEDYYRRYCDRHGLHREPVMEFEYRLLTNREGPLAKCEVTDITQLNSYMEVLHGDFQLPGGEGVQPFVAQTAVFTEQFHLKSPPFRRRSAARPASFLPGRPAPPLFSGACRRAGRLRRRCAVPAA